MAELCLHRELPFVRNYGIRLSVDAIRHTLCYYRHMKRFNWNTEKNEQLRTERGISFEEILFHIENGDILDILEHPNQERYEGQRIFVVAVSEYAHLVPFIEDDGEVFLKTIIPSRKATKKYLGK